MKKLLIPVIALLVASFGLVACGGDDDSTSAEGETTSSTTTESSGGGGGAGGTVSIVTSEGISYDESEVTTSAGENSLTFENNSGIPHDVVIEDDGGNEVAATDVISSGSAEATADLEAGTSYTFYCSVDGHRDQGMEGSSDRRVGGRGGAGSASRRGRGRRSRRRSTASRCPRPRG